MDVNAFERAAADTTAALARCNAAMIADDYRQARAALNGLATANMAEAWGALGTTAAALLAILDLHKPEFIPLTDGARCCEECEGCPDWPCSSAKAVLGALGLSASTEESRA